MTTTSVTEAAVKKIVVPTAASDASTMNKAGKVAICPEKLDLNRNAKNLSTFRKRNATYDTTKKNQHNISNKRGKRAWNSQILLAYKIVQESEQNK